jgi:hypothetical protein
MLGGFAIIDEIHFILPLLGFLRWMVGKMKNLILPGGG